VVVPPRRVVQFLDGTFPMQMFAAGFTAVHSRGELGLLADTARRGRFGRGGEQRDASRTALVEATALANQGVHRNGAAVKVVVRNDHSLGRLTVNVQRVTRVPPHRQLLTVAEAGLALVSLDHLVSGVDRLLGRN